MGEVLEAEGGLGEGLRCGSMGVVGEGVMCGPKGL